MITPEQIPTNFPTRLTTSQLDFFLPGLEKNFGVNLPVHIEIKLDSLHNFDSSASKKQLSAMADITATYYVHAKDGKILNAGSTTFHDTEFSLSLNVRSMKIQGKINSF